MLPKKAKLDRRSCDRPGCYEQFIPTSPRPKFCSKECQRAMQSVLRRGESHAQDNGSRTHDGATLGEMLAMRVRRYVQRMSLTTQACRNLTIMIRCISSISSKPICVSSM